MTTRFSFTNLTIRDTFHAQSCWISNLGYVFSSRKLKLGNRALKLMGPRLFMESKRAHTKTSTTLKIFTFRNMGVVQGTIGQQVSPLARRSTRKLWR